MGALIQLPQPPGAATEAGIALPDLLAATDHEVMEDSLEAASASGVDIVPRFFARFHAALPGQREKFYNRGSSEGQMVNEILALLLAQASGEAWLDMMLRASVNTHHDHGGIALADYRITFDVLVAVLRDSAGSGWTAEFDEVWQRQTDRLYALIERYY